MLKKRIRRRIFYATVLGATSVLTWAVWPKHASVHVPLGGKAAAAASAPDAGAKPDPAAAAAPAKTEVPKVRTYKVKQGDTLSGIAQQFGLSTDTLRWNNDLVDANALQIDQELQIPPVDGILHTVAKGDTLSDIAGEYGADLDAVVKANGDLSPDSLQIGQTVLVPSGTPARRSVAVASRSGGAPDRTAKIPGLIWPMQGLITEYFGWRIHPVYGTENYHEGIDIDAREGTPIAAIAAGTVTMADRYGGWGLTVKIDHGNGLVSRYSHLSLFQVKVGDKVTQGQIIAKSGNTGVTTGPHLDFGIYQDGNPIDTIAVLP
ncbi:MAG: peptidoglycan DD-metalloendopeptidase family protein [Mycobacterium leprae]